MDKKVVSIVIGVCALLVIGGVIIGGKQGKELPFVPGDESTKVDLRVTEQDYTLGNKNASVTLVEYGDFQCPACAAYHGIVKKIMDEMPNKVRLVFRHYPLTSIHDKAWVTAKAAEAAGMQNKFWQMYDELYLNQDSWGEQSPKDFLVTLDAYAKKIGLDMKKFKTDLDGTEINAAVKEDQTFGDTLGIRGTPTFYINGVYTQLPGSYEKFKAVLDAEVLKAPTPAPKAVHEHADLALFVDGKKFNLSDKKYDEKNPDIHIHDANGDIVHKHKTGVTMGTFFDALAVEVKPTVMYVNAIKYESDWKSYEFKNLDRIALATAELTPVQLKSVGDRACIYSETCPERGKPPTENCVGGLSTPCEVDKKN